MFHISCLTALLVNIFHQFHKTWRSVNNMSILKSRHSDLEIPQDVSIFNFLFQGTAEYKDKVAVMGSHTTGPSMYIIHRSFQIDDATGEQITYESFVEKVNTLACALNDRGLKKGDVVCLYAEKSILATVAVFAIVKLGAVMTPCRPSHTAREFAVQVNDSQASFVFADKHLIPVTSVALQNVPNIKSVFSIGHTDGYECLDDMFHRQVTEHMNIPICPREDAAFIVYSSGTTGLPKGAIQTHFGFIAGTLLLSDKRLKFSTCDTYFQNMPPFHTSGVLLISSYFVGRKTAILYTPPSVHDLLIKTQQYKVNNLFVTTNLLTELCKLPKEEIRKLGVDFSNLTFVTGGCVYNAVNTNEILSKTGVKALIQAYGSTEACAFATIDDVTDFVPGSAGLLAANIQMKIIDLATGKTLQPQERGEICLKGPIITKGYLNNPELTKETIDGDGWLHIGDIGYYDETGHLFIVDRLKDVIKYQTMQVSPAEIEEVIYTHPAVKTVCVVGIDDDSAGEVPLVCVIVKEGQSVSEEEIIKLVEDNLADYKRLRGGVKFVIEFPLTSIGKIIRREVREMMKRETKVHES